MKLIPYVLVSLLLALSAQAASVQGDITLPYSVMDTNKTVQTRECGDSVKAIWNCRVGEFYGWETVFARLTITNTGAKLMWGQCSVAFYDQDKNLVGTATQTFTARRGFKPGSRRLGFVRTIVLPKDRHRDIVSYQVVINETATPPSKQKEPMLLEDP
jgi:hypothetical protein